MPKKSVVFRLNFPAQVQEVLGNSGRLRKLPDLSTQCQHDVFQLVDGRVLIVFLRGLVFYSSLQEATSAIENRAYETYLELDQFEYTFPSAKIQNWVLEAVQYYHALDFFTDYHHLSNEAIVNEIVNQPLRGNVGKLFDSSYRPSKERVDIDLLSWDTQRVWWGDTECDVAFDNEIYEMKLEEWSQISRGVFQPEDIREYWKTETGPIWLEFTLNKQSHRIELEYNDDWLDLNLLTQVNCIISETDYQFVSYATHDQSLCLMVLNDAEKQRIAHERKLEFYS